MTPNERAHLAIKRHLRTIQYIQAVAEHWEDGSMGLRQIARNVGTTPQNLSLLAKRLGYPSRYTDRKLHVVGTSIKARVAEREATVRQVLSENGGSQAAAARTLGISRQYVYLILKRSKAR